MRVQLREGRDTSLDGSGNFNPSEGVLREVKVLGLASRNRMRYLPAAVRKAIPLYEGAPVYVDHPAGESNARNLRERFGRLRGIYQRNDGSLWAKEFRYNPAHPFAKSFAWHVRNDPKGIGFSHNAEGNGERDAAGEMVIDEISAVHSVDLVDGPATTSGLREQYEHHDRVPSRLPTADEFFGDPTLSTTTIWEAVFGDLNLPRNPTAAEVNSFFA